MNQRRTVSGVHFIRVKGSLSERAREHGRLLREEIKEGSIPSLAKKNEMLIRKGPGLVQFSLVQNSIVWLYKNVLIPSLAKRVEPDYLEGIRAMSKETGFSFEDLREASFQPDGLLLLARLSMMDHLKREIGPANIGACSSAVVMRDWTKSGRLLQCRNFDYPVVGPWESATTVAFNEPDQGKIPFTAVTSAGVQTGGITAINQEGMTLASHNVFSRSISLSGLPFITIGDQIISRAKTLGEAVDIARKMRPMMPWSFVIASAKENDAVVLEMTSKKISVSPTLDGFLAHSNFFQSPEFKHEDVVLSGATHDDFEARYCRMKQILEPLRGVLEPDHMAAALGDHIDPNTLEKRVFGNTLSVMTTVQSAVLEPETMKVWVSARGESPMGLGEYLEVDIKNFWNEPNTQLPKMISASNSHEPRFLNAVKSYRRAYQAWHMRVSDADHKTNAFLALKEAVEQYPEDGHLWVQLGLVAFKQKEFTEARQALIEATARKLSSHVLAVCDLFLARCFDLEGKRSEARALYSKIGVVHEPRLRKAYREGLRRSYRASRADNLELDFQFPDAFRY